MGRISLFLLIVSVFVVGAKRKISSEVQDDERHRRCSACKAIQNAVQEDAVARLKDKPNWSAARRRRAIFMSIEESCVNLNGFVSVGSGKEQRYMRLSDAVRVRWFDGRAEFESRRPTQGRLRQGWKAVATFHCRSTRQRKTAKRRRPERNLPRRLRLGRLEVVASEVLLSPLNVNRLE